LRRSIWIIILTCLCVIVANAQSNRPIPSPRIKGNPPQIHPSDNQQKAESDKRGTEQSPLVVKTINPPNSETEAKQEREQRNEQSSQNRWLVKFTGGLFIATILLFGVAIWQGWHLKRSVDSLQTTQRAYVSIKELIHTVKPAEGFGEIIIVLENTGETPVRKMICNFNHRCFPEDIPSGFDYPDTDPPVYGTIGRKTTLDARVRMPFTAFEDARTKKQRFYIYGWIDYYDVFPNTPRHRAEFCYEVMISKDRKFIYKIYGTYNGYDDECSRKPSPYVPPT